MKVTFEPGPIHRRQLDSGIEKALEDLFVKPANIFKIIVCFDSMTDLGAVWFFIHLQEWAAEKRCRIISIDASPMFFSDWVDAVCVVDNSRKNQLEIAFAKNV